MASIDLEILQEKHLDDLVLLYDEIFGKKVSRDFFMFKYGLHLPTSKQLSIVGLEKGKAVGFFGALRQQYRYQGQVFQVLHICDYYIQSRFRGQGVFDELYFEVLRKAEQEKISYLYAYTSDQTAKFSIKHGLSEAPTFLRFEMNLFPKWFKSVLVRTLGEEWTLTKLKHKLKPYEHIISPGVLALNEEAGMIYDSDFLEMKRNAPRFFVKLHGCRMWMKYDYRLTIGWMKIEEGADLRKAMKALQTIAFKSGVHEIVMHVTPTRAAELSLKDYLTEKPSFRVFVKKMNKELPDFDTIPIAYINGDLF